MNIETNCLHRAIDELYIPLVSDDSACSRVGQIILRKSTFSFEF